MPVTLKTNKIKLKDQNGNYQAPVILADETTAQHVATVNAAITQTGQTELAAITAKGEETLASIPSDYTALSNQVNGIEDEVEDIRTPASDFNENTAYSTAGDAVRGQIETLDETIDRIGNPISVTLTSGKYYNQNGTTGNYSVYSISDKIPTSINGIACDIEFKVKVNTATYCLFYDENGTIIDTLLPDADDKVIRGNTSNYNGCAYFAISNKNDYTPTFIAYPKSDSISKKLNINSKLAISNLRISGKITDIASQLNITNGYIDTHGYYHSYATTRVTDYIDINDYADKIIIARITLAEYGNPTVAVYGDNRTYLGGLTLGEVDSVNLAYEIDNVLILSQYPSARYIRISSWAGNAYNIFETNKINNVESFNKLYDYIDNINKNTLESIVEYTNIANNLTYTNGYLSRYTGELTSYFAEGTTVTDYIDIDEYTNKVFKITNVTKYDNATLVLYDSDHNTIKVLSNSNLNNYILNINSLKILYEGVKYFRIGSFIDKPIVELSTKLITDSKVYRRTDITNIVGVINAYINYADGRTISYENSKTTRLIKLDEYDTIYYRGKASESNACMWCLYDASGSVVAKQQASFSNVLIQNYAIDLKALALLYPTATHIRICSIYFGLSLSAFRYLYNDDVTKTLTNMNVLYGKKYVSCGDSFTEGPFTGEWATEDNYSYDYQCWKTYPYWIASRNNMDLLNEAKSGSQMYNNGNPDSNAFSIQRYKDIPEDADYITLMFGLNETGAPIGTLADTENTTVMGAWNVVLSYLIEHHPYAKIGIIIADSWLSGDQYNAQKQIAEYWGIPYLDLRGGIQVPMGINGRIGSTISPTAKSLRDQSFVISNSDAHPNPYAHKYRSTFIEAWLRTL